MRIALTGASGFAGGHILRALLAAGHEASILARRVQPKQFSENVNVIVGDLHDLEALKRLVIDQHAVIHCAGAITAVREAEYFRVNYAGTQNVFSVAQQAGVKRSIFISSLAARMPGISPYAASKRAAEDYLLSTHPSAVILRPAAVYGPGDKATFPLLSALQRRVALVPGLAKSRFSLLHVADLARVVADAVTSKATGLFEIDDMNGGYKWADFAALNFKHFGTPHHLTFLPKTFVNLVAMGAEIGAIFTGLPGMVNRGKVRELYHEDWVVRGKNWPRSNPILLEQGLVETINWYVAQGWLPPHTQKATRTNG
jgi:nucleoside-diphosphate-sugar epimerase